MSIMSEERILESQEISKVLTEELKNWSLEGGYITKSFNTKNWKETIFLVNAIAYLAEAQNHHPDLEVSFKSLRVKLKTHSANGITQKDVKLAKVIDMLLSMA